MFENTPYYLRIFEKNMGFDLEQMELLTNNKTFTSCNKVIFEWLQIYWIGFCSLALLEGQTIMASSWFDELLVPGFANCFSFSINHFTPSICQSKFCLRNQLGSKQSPSWFDWRSNPGTLLNKKTDPVTPLSIGGSVLCWFLGSFPEILLFFNGYIMFEREVFLPPPTCESAIYK